jgi:uncharacterized protein
MTGIDGKLLRNFPSIRNDLKGDKKMKRHSLPIFFILAFAFPWLIWGTTLAESRGLLSFHIPQSLAFWIGLNLATYLTAALTGGWAAVKDLLSRLVRWRVPPVWYLVALGITGLLSLAAIGIHLALGGTHQVGVLLSLQALLPSLLFQIFFFLLTEETAWRGFALPRLQAKYSSLNASLILGVLWGLWHLPLFFIPGSFQSTLPFVGFLLATLAQTIITTWVFNHTRGSVLLAAILHGSTDATIAFANVMSADLRLFWIFVVLQLAFAAFIVVTQGAKRFSKDYDLNGAVVPAGS